MYEASDDAKNDWFSLGNGWCTEDISELLGKAGDGKIGRKKKGINFRNARQYVNVTDDMVSKYTQLSTYNKVYPRTLIKTGLKNKDFRIRYFFVGELKQPLVFHKHGRLVEQRRGFMCAIKHCNTGGKKGWSMYTTTAHLMMEPLDPSVTDATDGLDESKSTDHILINMKSAV